jgi:hypothetical protein
MRVKKIPRSPNNAKLFEKQCNIHFITGIKKDGSSNDDLFLKHVLVLTYVGQSVLLFSNMHLNVH